MQQLNIQYNIEADEVVIDGIKYSGSFFRRMSSTGWVFLQADSAVCIIPAVPKEFSVPTSFVPRINEYVRRN